MIVAAPSLQANFGRAAATYDAHATIQRAQVKRVFALARQHFPASVRVVDIGCGTGLFAEQAAQAAPGWRITGLDYAFPMAEQARARCAALQADATRLPIADASVEGVVSSLCLQWVDDKPKAFAEIHRILKPGGMAVVATLGDGTLYELHTAAHVTGIPLGLLPMVSAESYRTLVSDTGLVVHSVDSVREVQSYASVEALLDSIRVIGAGNAGEKRAIGPRKFARFVGEYEARYAIMGGIAATWEPVLMLLEKRA